MSRGIFISIGIVQQHVYTMYYIRASTKKVPKQPHGNKKLYSTMGCLFCCASTSFLVFYFSFAIFYSFCLLCSCCDHVHLVNTIISFGKEINRELKYIISMYLGTIYCSADIRERRDHGINAGRDGVEGLAWAEREKKELVACMMAFAGTKNEFLWFCF
jgi:hypothetical protein